MCIVSFAMTGEKSIFKGISGVRGDLKEFEEINVLLEKYPVFPLFDLSKW